MKVRGRKAQYEQGGTVRLGAPAKLEITNGITAEVDLLADLDLGPGDMALLVSATPRLRLVDGWRTTSGPLVVHLQNVSHSMLRVAEGDPLVDLVCVKQGKAAVARTPEEDSG